MTTTTRTTNTIVADAYFPALRDHIIATTGLVFYANCQQAMAGHIAERIEDCSLTNCLDYLELLQQPRAGEAELDTLTASLTIGETFFFRHPELFDQMQRARQYGTGTEFESLYPFRLGDDPRRIDWRATARQQTLVVRRFQIERHRDVMIILDSGRLMGADVGRGSKLNCAVDAALNLARVVLASGDRCGVAAYDRQVRGFLPPIAGTSALRALVQSVSGLETQWHESDFTPMLAELRQRQAKRTFLIVISDVADAETSQRLCASLVQLQRQHLVLFAALRTPQLSQVVDEHIREPRDAARKAVAFRLIRDRGRALHSLTRGGVHVLDVEPRELTAPLVNQFIQLRQRNLL